MQTVQFRTSHYAIFEVHIENIRVASSLALPERSQISLRVVAGSTVWTITYVSRKLDLCHE